MKILQINAVNNYSSTGRNVIDLSETLFNSGHDSMVAFSKGSFHNVDNEFKIGSVVDTKIHALLSRIFGKQGYFSRKATKKFLKFMISYKPDVVVLHNLHGNYINLPLLLEFLNKENIATVAVLHDCWFYTGKCCHYTVENCMKWKEQCEKCPSLKKHNPSWFFDKTKSIHTDKIKLFTNIDNLTVVGVSDWIVNEAKQSPVFANAKDIRRIYNWVDTNIFIPRNIQAIKDELGLTGKKVLLSVAYGWSADKGINTILEMSEKLKDDERFLLVGDISNDVVLNDNIIHIPTTECAETLAKYYSVADVFVQPSLEETFGKVTAEALACGTPVVCFNSTTTPELIDNNCGMVVDSFDSESLLNATRTILNNGKEFYLQHCRNSAINKFSKKDRLEDYISMFENIIG